MNKHYDIMQIGAHNGYTLNDRYINDILKIEHNAIFVEPIKEIFESLVKNHNRFRPNNNYVFLNVACSNHIGTLDLYIPDIEIFDAKVESKYIQLGLPNWTDQLVSIFPNHVKDHNINLNTKRITVECTTLNEIIRAHNVGSIDVLYIDTEGHDCEVLEGLDFSKIKPNTIVFENKHFGGTNLPKGEKYEKLIAYLYKIGYETLLEEGDNTYIKLKL